VNPIFESFFLELVDGQSGELHCSECCVDVQSRNKENVDMTTSRFIHHEKLSAAAAAADDDDRDEDVMLMMRDQCRDGTRLDVSVSRDRQAVGVGEHRAPVMKRKTLRRCDDGQMSVSESFTESEAAEAGTQSVVL